jgi:hypothetical protein
MFVWDNNVNRHFGYRIWDGANLSGMTSQNIQAMGNDKANWFKLAPDPYTDHIMLGIEDNANDLTTSLWHNGAWDDATSVSQDTNIESLGDRIFDVTFETWPANAGYAWVVWGSQATNNLRRRQWNGAAWLVATNTGDHTELVQLLAQPYSGAVFSGMYASQNAAAASRIIWESHLTTGGAAWPAGFTVWGGATANRPVEERVFIGAEKYALDIDWLEIFQ